MARKSRPSDETTRQRVLRSAVEQFAAKGFHGTGIRDIADSADLTVSALYHYMTNKEDLLVEIMESTVAPLHEAARAILAEASGPAEALCRIVETHVTVHSTDRLACIVTDSEIRALSGERLVRMVAMRDAYEALWRDTIASGVASGCFRSEAPAVAARALLQMATGVSHWFSPGGTLSLEALCQLYSNGALGFLHARGNDGGPLAKVEPT